MRQRVWLWTGMACLGCFMLAGLRGEQAEQADPDYAAELPRIAPRSPEESLKLIKLKAGFHAELVASEPLVRSPMGMDFDENGHAFVVELPEYNQYGSTKPHGKGGIKRLTDTDGDGRYDAATTYVDNLDYPTAVACWDGGILVGVAPDILYCKDTDGDGRADIRRRVFTGFGQDKAGEGMLNSFRWRFDNTIHIPTGLDGGEITRVEEPAATGTAANETANQTRPASNAAPPVSARGQHLLYDPRSGKLTPTSGGGQHGMSLDDWNLHAFVCGNSEPVHLVMYDGRYLARNPYLQAPAAAINIAPEGKFTKLMRLSAVEPWRILRTRLRKAGTIPGSDEGGSPSGFFTGATGITVYRGDAWPAEYRGNLFVGEVANNLVYRARLEPNGVGLTAHRADADAEFLASSDNWFRPVQFANAPDGTLYVIDMYRELIEGAAFLAPQILKHMDASAGANQGRIYRIAPDGFQPRPLPRLGDMSTTDLVALYEHPNGWHRDTASRLIYQRQDQSAIAPLKDMASHSQVPLARVMALYSLRGLQALDQNLVLAALKSPEPAARIHALRLSEAYGTSPEIRTAVLSLVADPDVRVRYQVAFSLGAFSGDDVTHRLAQMAHAESANPWFQLAILSSISDRRGPFLAELSKLTEGKRNKGISDMLVAVAGQVGAAGVKLDLEASLAEINRIAQTAGGETEAATLLRTLVSQLTSASGLLEGAPARTTAMLQKLISEAREISRNGQVALPERIKAVRTLALAPFPDNQEIYAELLGSKVELPVQTTVLETLARSDDPGVPQLILDAWGSQTPTVRATSIETLFARPAWITTFLDAVANEQVARADIDPARIALLQKHGDPAIRERALALFGSGALARRQEVVDAYQKALESSGDIERGRMHFRKICAACHKLEGVGESIGADLNAIRDRGLPAVLLNILDPNREVKPQFFSYVVVLDSGRSLTGMIASETANSLTIRKGDNTTETVLRVNIDELKNTGISFMPEGLEKQLDVPAMADLLAYLNSIK